MPYMSLLRSTGRYFSTAQVAQGAPKFALDSAKVQLPRSVVAVHGPDSSKFLNGLISNRVPNLKSSHQSSNSIANYCAMLNAKGRIFADLFVYNCTSNYPVKSILEISEKESSAGVFLIDLDTTLLEGLLSNLKFHVLTSKVKISPLPSLKVFHLWNDNVELNTNELYSKVIAYTKDTRAEGLGFRCIVADESNFTLSTPLNQGTNDDFRVRRYLFGVPEGAAEIIPNKSLPLDFCMDFMNGVDFTKGCYIGQELTIRTKHHGSVRKRVVPFVALSSKDAEIKEDVYEGIDYNLKGDVYDEKPIPNSESFSNVFDKSPFNLKPRASGRIVASLGNVGLARLRVDLVGHEFKVDNVYLKALTPFWWPEDAVKESKKEED